MYSETRKQHTEKREEKEEMRREEYWSKVEDYAYTFSTFGNDWKRDDIIFDMVRCRDDGEWFLEKMSEEEFTEFSSDVADFYFECYYMR